MFSHPFICGLKKLVGPVHPGELGCTGVGGAQGVLETSISGVVFRW